MKSTIDKLKERSEALKKDAELSKEDFEELRKACRVIFSSKEGKFVANKMMKVSGIYKFPNFTKDPQDALRKEGLIYFYLFFVKGMLTPKNIMDIENRGGS